MGRARWIVPIVFLVIALGSALAAWSTRRDGTWLQIWLGVGLTFLTAAVVDFVALADSHRKESAAADRLKPVERIIVRHMREQRGDLYSLVAVVFGIQNFADGADLTTRLRALPKGPVVAADSLDETMWPHETRSVRARATIDTLQGRQKDLEALAATGLHGPDIEALSAVVLHGTFVELTKGTFWGKNSIEQQAAAKQAAKMLDDLHIIPIPPW